jgi:metal-responsive CopG/Arc/MetJ family transcriptional regulator
MRRRIIKNGGVMLGVMLPPEMKAALDKIADEREAPTSVLVRQILRHYLTTREQAQQDARGARGSSVWPISKPRVAAGGSK